jgi:phage terminase large subunit-like protein
MDARVEFWIPADTIQARMGPNQPPWDAWVEAGHVHASPGRVVNYADVAHRLAEIASQCNLISVGFDAYQIKFFELELQRLGITLPLVAHPQGTLKSQESLLWMPRSIELTEKRLFEKTIRIERNPCLWWNVQCAAIETDRHQNRTFSKKKSRGSVDGVVSLAMAVGTSQLEAPKPPEFQVFFI